MNIVKRLAVKNLKLNKKRTISTVIGIILSTALICGTTTLVTSVQKTLVQNAINQAGYYHVKLNRISSDEIKDIEQNRDIKDKMIIENLGYAELKDCKNLDKPYVKVLSSNEESFNELMLKIDERKISKK